MSGRSIEYQGRSKQGFNWDFGPIASVMQRLKILKLHLLDLPFSFMGKFLRRA